MRVPRSDITGLVLAGGRGTRMGGVDKGLQPFRGTTLARHALQRLAAQTGPVALNANIHLDLHRAAGVPVWPDSRGDRPGPLAGILAGLTNCATPWLASVPCDCPNFPADLVPRLADAVATEGAEIAVAATLSGDGSTPQLQPVFCLIAADLAYALARYLEDGGRRVDAWTAQHRRVVVLFEDAAAFANANTRAELRALEDA